MGLRGRSLAGGGGFQSGAPGRYNYQAEVATQGAKSLVQGQEDDGGAC